MSRRHLETRLARFTLGVLVVYFPLETWISSPDLLNPFYIVDVIGMALLLSGVIRSLAARPRSAPGVLCAGYAWTAAVFWRGTSDRWAALRGGRSLQFGPREVEIA